MLTFIQLNISKEQDFVGLKGYNSNTLPIYNEDLISIWLKKLKNQESIVNYYILTHRDSVVFEKINKYRNIFNVNVTTIKSNLGSAYELANFLFENNFPYVVINLEGYYIQKFDFDNLELDNKIYLAIDYVKEGYNSYVLEEEFIFKEKVKGEKVFAGLIIGKSKKIINLLGEIEEKNGKFDVRGLLTDVYPKYKDKFDFIEVDNSFLISDVKSYFKFLEKFGINFLNEKIDANYLGGNCYGKCYIGNSYIYEGAKIRNSYVGNGVVIHDDTKIVNSIILDYSEIGYNNLIKNSLIMENVVIGDFNRVNNVIIGKGSAIKNFCNILRDKNNYKVFNDNSVIEDYYSQ